MKEPTLVILAAGMGSRYGGLKQIDPIDEEGHVIIDYSLYDAKRAGFKNVIFITKKADEADFKSAIADRMKEHFNVEIVLQDMENIPEGFEVPKERVKPWGTSHAIYCCGKKVDGPICVINADDYYGVSAYQQIYDFLTTHEDGQKASYAMVGYMLKNTISETGHVARGVCEISDGKLVEITERTRIQRVDGVISYSEDDGNSWNPLNDDTVVSMNMWGFTDSIIKEINGQISEFLKETISTNPLKGEFFLPSAVDKAIKGGRAEVTVLTSKDKWHGVTYKEDKPEVMAAMKKMKEEGIYPKHLWK